MDSLTKIGMIKMRYIGFLFLIVFMVGCSTPHGDIRKMATPVVLYDVGVDGSTSQGYIVLKDKIGVLWEYKQDSHLLVDHWGWACRIASKYSVGDTINFDEVKFRK